MGRVLHSIARLERSSGRARVPFRTPLLLSNSNRHSRTPCGPFKRVPVASDPVQTLRASRTSPVKRSCWSCFPLAVRPRTCAVPDTQHGDTSPTRKRGSAYHLHLRPNMVAWPYNIAMNLTVRPVTHLADSAGQQQHERERARCVPVQPAGYRGRYAA